jgi:hypothetical protein
MQGSPIRTWLAAAVRRVAWLLMTPRQRRAWTHRAAFLDAHRPKP